MNGKRLQAFGEIDGFDAVRSVIGAARWLAGHPQWADELEQRLPEHPTAVSLARALQLTRASDSVTSGYEPTLRTQGRAYDFEWSAYGVRTIARCDGTNWSLLVEGTGGDDQMEVGLTGACCNRVWSWVSDVRDEPESHIRSAIERAPTIDIPMLWPRSSWSVETRTGDSQPLRTVLIGIAQALSRHDAKHFQRVVSELERLGEHPDVADILSVLIDCEAHAPSQFPLSLYLSGEFAALRWDWLSGELFLELRRNVRDWVATWHLFFDGTDERVKTARADCVLSDWQERRRPTGGGDEIVDLC